MLVKELPPEKQTRVLRLHNQAFGGDTACKQCPGNCCADCARAQGYRYDWEPGEKEKFGFDEKTGFKGETGCKLPLTERSSTCLCFACDGVNHCSSGLKFAPPLGVDKPFSLHRRQYTYRINAILHGYEEDKYL